MDIERVEAFMKRVEQSERETFAPVGQKLKVGVDLGTAYIVLVVLDEENNPVACEKQAADVLRDGVVVDYLGALRIVKELKAKLEKRIGRELVNCAIAMPAGTESSVKTHQYVAEGADLEVTAVLDEPSAANAGVPDFRRRHRGYRRRNHRSCDSARREGDGDRRRAYGRHAPDAGAGGQLPYPLCRGGKNQAGLLQTQGNPSRAEAGD